MRLRPLLIAICACGPSKAPPQSHPTGDSAAPAGDSGGAPEDSADPTLRGPLQLALPLTEPERIEIIIGVDHDPVVQEEGIWQLVCLDYVGRAFPHCYDEHDGSDFILLGAFGAMDAGSSPVVAAAPGRVVATEDGHYDRCHGDLGSGGVSCDGHEMIANSVIIEHEGGWRSLYWHLKEGSVAVAVGQEVEAGEQLGLIGSSGNSTTPHLHFELQDAERAVIDPFAGPYSQPETWWCSQGGPDDLPGGC
jgi:murein DD-endopeptidase MepM/ murein hydrolase activator NlpD